MGLKIWAVALGAVALAGAGAAMAQPLVPVTPAPVPAPPGASAAAAPAAALPRVEGYLGKDRIPNSIAILPPPPPHGSTAEKEDEEVYRATRKLEGTPRWTLASRDAVQYLQAFECPLGLPVGAWPRPLTTLLLRIGRDASAITNLAKDHFAHPRPFIPYGGAICTESDRQGLMKSYGYPSGHATFSWSVALILAEMAPERATEILARARAFGESRVVCGVHTVSDIEEGRINAASLVAVLHSDAAFRSDVAEATAALRAAMTAPHVAPDAGQCKIEAEAEAHTPWANPTGDK